MPNTITDTISLTVPAYKCPNCGYKHQASFDAYEPGRMAQEFPEFPGITDGACPACYSGKNPQRIALPSMLELYSDPGDSFVTNTASDSELEAIQVPDLDANGQQLTEQVGTHFEQVFDRTTGKTSVVEVPDYAPKMRPLTDQELADLKAQRDANLDELEAVAV